MNQGSVTVEFEKYHSSDELGKEDAALLQAAKQAVSNAYAPYSGFNVGAAAKLSDGAIVTGSNQENASFPVGMCAERVCWALLLPCILLLLFSSGHQLQGFCRQQ